MAIAISIIVIIITVSTGYGLKKTITQNLINIQSHIQITHINQNNETQSISIHEDTFKKIKSIAGVKQIHPIILKSSIIKNNDTMEGVIIKAIQNDYKKDFIKKHITQGTYFKNEANDQMLISEQQAQKLNLKNGDHCILYFLSQKKNIQKRKFYIAGVFDFKNEEFNQNFCLVKQNALQKINKWEDNQYTQFEIELNKSANTDKVSKEITKLLDYNLIAQTLSEKFSKLFQWIKLFDKNIAFILIIMTLICIINMTNTLLILIIERIQMIGILKSFGCTNYSIIKIFLYNSINISIKSIITGNIIALILCYIQIQTQLISLDPKSYFIDSLPLDINLKWIIIINIVTFFLIQFSIIVPYFAINKLSPTKILKFK